MMWVLVAVVAAGCLVAAVASWCSCDEVDGWAPTEADAAEQERYARYMAGSVWWKEDER